MSIRNNRYKRANFFCLSLNLFAFSKKNSAEFVFSNKVITFIPLHFSTKNLNYENKIYPVALRQHFAVGP